MSEKERMKEHGGGEEKQVKTMGRMGQKYDV